MKAFQLNLPDLMERLKIMNENVLEHLSKETLRLISLQSNTFKEVLHIQTIKSLQHADKLRLMQFLLTEFAHEKHINLETTDSKPKPVDALQSLANIAQPLGDENLARNFKDHKRQLINNETAQ